MNKAIICGNMGSDPEVRTTNNNGKYVCNFIVATNEYFIRQGEKVQETTWHNCVAWDAIAEAVGKLGRKGARVLVEGRIQNGMRERHDGSKVFKSEIRVSHIEFLIKREDEKTN